MTGVSFTFCAFKIISHHKYFLYLLVLVSFKEITMAKAIILIKNLCIHLQDGSGKVIHAWVKKHKKKEILLETCIFAEVIMKRSTGACV